MGRIHIAVAVGVGSRFVPGHQAWTWPVLAASVFEPSGGHSMFDLGADARWAPVWPRGTIEEAGVSFGVEAGDPTVCALPGDTHCLGYMSNW